MRKEQIQSLKTGELWSIVRSTNACGGLWLELSWAKEELARRYARNGKRLVGL